MNAVICDDNKSDATRLARIVESGNIHVVHTGENGRELLNYLRRNEPVDLILLDIVMPVLDGYAAFHEIREHRIPARIVFVSIENSSQLVENVIKLGARGFITKPFDRERVLESLKKAVAQPPSTWQ